MTDKSNLRVPAAARCESNVSGSGAGALPIFPELEMPHEKLRLGSLLKFLPVPVYHKDIHGRYLGVNPAFETLFGKTQAEVFGQTVFDANPEEWARIYHAKDTELFERPGSQMYESKVRNARGELRDVNFLKATMTDGTGAVTGLVGVVLDITERKQAENALRETNEYLDNLFNYANAPVIVWNPQFKVTRFNHAFESLTGRPAAEVLGQSLEILFPPECAARSMDLIQKTSRGERWETVEIAIQHRDQSVHTVLWNSAPIFTPDGKVPVATIAQGQDITERKRSEEELRGRTEELQIKNRHLECLFELSHVIEDNSDRGPRLYTLMIPVLQKALNRPNSPCIAIAVDDIAVSSAAKETEPTLADVFPITVGGEKRGEIRVERSPQDPVIFLTTDETTLLTAVAERMGRLALWFDALQVAQKRQEQLIQADKLASLGVLVAGVAHEINNPVNNIMLNASLLRDFVSDMLPILDAHRQRVGDFSAGGLPYSEMRDCVPELLKGILSGSERIKNITADLRDSVPTSFGVAHEMISANNVVAAAIRMCAHLDKHFLERMQVSLSDNLPLVPCSPRRLEQVVINLLQNAWQALRNPAARIFATTRHDPATGRVVVEVRDEGCGMPPDVVSRIKDPFFTTRRAEGGTGLGIPISNGIIEEMGGCLEFESTVGQGTTARIGLPTQGTARHA